MQGKARAEIEREIMPKPAFSLYVKITHTSYAHHYEEKIGRFYVCVKKIEKFLSQFLVFDLPINFILFR